MKLSLRKRGEPGAGLVCVEFGTSRIPARDGSRTAKYFLHLFVKRDSWEWGYEEDWYDGPLPSFGLGPLLLLAWWD